MLLPAGPPRRVWVVMVEAPRSPIEDPRLGGLPAETPLALFPPQWGVARLIPIVDSFVQLLHTQMVDKLDYRMTSRVPYPARLVGFGTEVEGGWNPTVVAFRVRNFQVLVDDDTGEDSATFTREAFSEPEWFRREREQGLR